MTIRFKKYIDEARGLGIFMCSAGFFDGIINYPGLPIRHLLTSALLRRFLVGLAMGLTALYIFTSAFGKQSGAYINPAVTLVRYRMHDISAQDAIFYCIAQCLGGSAGLGLVVLLFPKWMRHPDINYIVTVPGRQGITIAFILEMAISFILISVVLFLGMKKRWNKYTPAIVSALITVFITVESPFSGMSMNPARSFSSAFLSNEWKSFWIYCLAPVLGMLAGEWLYKYVRIQMPGKRSS